MPTWRMVSDTFTLILQTKHVQGPSNQNDFTIRRYCYLKARLKLEYVM